MLLLILDDLPAVTYQALFSTPTEASSLTRLKRCEYYEQLLSRPPAHPPVDLAQAAASTPEDTTLDCGPPTAAEVTRAIGRLKAGKAPGISGSRAEQLKAGGHHTAQWLTKVFQAVWQSGQMPSDWKKGIFLMLYERFYMQLCKVQLYIDKICA